MCVYIYKLREKSKGKEYPIWVLTVNGYWCIIYLGLRIHQHLTCRAKKYFNIIFLNIKRYISSSSSSCRAISTDISDPLSPPFFTVHCFRLVFRATTRIDTELLYVCSSWSSNLFLSMWRDPQECITYELIPTSPTVSCMSASFNFDSFRDGLLVAVQMLLCRMLPPGLGQYCWQHSCVVAVKLFLYTFT